MAMAPDTPRKDASNRFDYLLNLATCAFGGDEDAAELEMAAAPRVLACFVPYQIGRHGE